MQLSSSQRRMRRWHESFSRWKRAALVWKIPMTFVQSWIKLLSNQSIIDCRRKSLFYLTKDDFFEHFSEEIGWTAWPAMLLVSISLEGTWKFIFDLKKTRDYFSLMELLILLQEFNFTVPQLTDKSPTKTNFQPLRLALTARSMSSTVVLSFHPPASFTAWIRHTPAVPLCR